MYIKHVSYTIVIVTKYSRNHDIFTINSVVIVPKVLRKTSCFNNHNLYSIESLDHLQTLQILQTSGEHNRLISKTNELLRLTDKTLHPETDKLLARNVIFS